LYGSKWNLIDKMKAAYAEHGVMYLHVHKVALQQDLMFKKPIARLSDLKGMKIRTYGLMAKWVTAAGAGTVWFPGAEIYTSLAAGTVDAVSWAGPAEFWDLRAHEVAKYYLPGALLLVGDNDLINMKAWNSLPNDLKLIVELVMAETSTLSTQETFLQDELAMKKMIKEWGVKRVVLPPEDLENWREMAVPIWDEVAKANARSAEWVSLTKDWMKWRGYLK
jgi:TRAP-type C4-dicarboxylate transport system substrate-binding protein